MGNRAGSGGNLPLAVGSAAGAGRAAALQEGSWSRWDGESSALQIIRGESSPVFHRAAVMLAFFWGLTTPEQAACMCGLRHSCLQTLWGIEWGTSSIWNGLEPMPVERASQGPAPRLAQKGGARPGQRHRLFSRLLAKSADPLISCYPHPHHQETP